MVAYLVNFIAVGAGICLFFLPFVAVFAFKHRREIIAKRPHFNQFMERFFSSRQSNYLVLTWAAAEAVVWYVIPEFLLLLVVFMKVHKKRDLVKYDLIGTVIGTLVAFMWHLSPSALVHLPYVRPSMIEQVRNWFETSGVFGLLHQPFSGVPYKVFTHMAPDYHFNIILFLLVAIAARMFRYLVLYAAFVGAYPVLHKLVRRHYALLFLLAIAIFSAMLLQVLRAYN
ncbi:MAG: hypothetical protein JWM37_588 [Candidatus Saccharibacteria bacterium]|nr:hypothetical protein [Candidatus Saccharibacteria bacterium]